MNPIIFIAIFLGVMLVIFGLIWLSVNISGKRDKNKYLQQKSENQARLLRIEKYLESIANSLDDDGKQLIFKLSNRWKIIYKHLPMSYGNYGYQCTLPHPQMLSACADRDRIEIMLMDKGVNLEYPD